jgi:ADP-ribosylglycohydrolase
MFELMDLDGTMCYQTLSVAIWCLVRNIDSLSPRTILAKGIAYGGDCDTIGSLIGQMMGMLYGEIAMKLDWLSKIEGRKVITNLSHEILKKYR